MNGNKVDDFGKGFQFVKPRQVILAKRNRLVGALFYALYGLKGSEPFSKH